MPWVRGLRTDRITSPCDIRTFGFFHGMQGRYATFEDFFLYYLRQHREPRNRLLHACGTAAGVLIVATSLVLHHPWFALLFLPVAYGFAWFGHLVIERNQPATWNYPWWSFVADFRMLALMVTGQLESWLARADDDTENKLATSN